jgi:hypothetical protein
MNPASTATIKRATRSPARHREQGHSNGAELNVSGHQSPHTDRNELATQHLTIVLEGITTGDYLTWVRDPEPHTLGRELRSIDWHAAPLGDRIDVLLHWNTNPPVPPAAAPAAGFHLTPEVVEIRARHP